MNRFQNKVAIVTGGAGGIGAAIASRLASEGATVVVSDVNLEAAQAVVQAIEAEGGKALAMAADIASGEACRGLVQAVASEFGRIDVLVNNAGINRRGNLLALSEDDWHSSFAVNLDAMFHLCRAVLPGMIEAGGGAIVNTASQW
ncbi:MAG: SDR family NAD(P)-dependent oxidoreductase, partial [Janthinobacterium sp.]